MKDKNIIILEIPYEESENNITGAKIVYVYNYKKADELDRVFNFLQNRINPYKKVRYEKLFLAREEEKKRYTALSFNEEELIEIYRHLKGSNKYLIMRTIKNLDTYYSSQPYLQYFWDYNSPCKITHFTLAESDLIATFRTLTEIQQQNLLKSLHLKVLNHKEDLIAKTLSEEDRKLIDSYHTLNTACKKLVKDMIKNLNRSTMNKRQIKSMQSK